MKRKSIFVSLLLVFLLAITACGNNGSENGQEAEEETTSEVTLPTIDRAGNEIEIKENIETIVSFGPAISQTLEDLGVMDKVVAVDTQTPMFVEGVEELPQLDMLNLDMEQLLELDPDIIYASEITFGQDETIFQVLIDAGITVAKIPTSTSIADIQADTSFIADSLGLHTEGEALNEEMQASLDEIAAIGKTIEDKKTVLFEISPLPDIFSFGSGVFLDEMINLIGAENIFADQTGWLPVSEETAVDANPDVILTNVNFIDDPVGEIMVRPGWQDVTAVKNEAVFQVDNGFTSLPNNRIVLGLKEMAQAVYPDYFGE